jgi:hypothetical protein
LVATLQVLRDAQITSKAQRPDGKPGRELALRAEGFFRLDFLLLFYQENGEALLSAFKNKQPAKKSNSPAVMSGPESLPTTRIRLLRNEAPPFFEKIFSQF